MKVAVTAGAVRRAKLITANVPSPEHFYRPDALPVAQPTASERCWEKPNWVFTRSDRWTVRSVRLVCPTIVSCKRFVRPVGQTVGRIKHV